MIDTEKRVVWLFLLSALLLFIISGGMIVSAPDTTVYQYEVSIEEVSTDDAVPISELDTEEAILANTALTEVDSLTESGTEVIELSEPVGEYESLFVTEVDGVTLLVRVSGPNKTNELYFRQAFGFMVFIIGAILGEFGVVVGFEEYS